MGQGIRSTLAAAVADELGADWARVRIVQADGDEPAYGSQNTDGSHSVTDFLTPLREMGAAARLMLEAAAATKWGVAGRRRPDRDARGDPPRPAAGGLASARSSTARADSARAGQGAADAQAAVVAAAPGQGDSVCRRPGDDDGQGRLRHRRVAARDEDRRGRAAAGGTAARSRRCSRPRPRRCPASSASIRLPEARAAVRLQAARRRGGRRAQHPRGDSGPQRAEDHVGRRRQRDVRLDRISRGA